MNSDLSKKQMLLLLHSLDKKLEKPMELHICGGAACIVGHNFARRSMDIDVLASSPMLESIHNQIKEVAHEMHLEDEKWINNDSIRGDHYIPEDYKERLIEIKDNFNHLRVFCLSKADIAITKLSIYRIRERDVNDISELKLTHEDYRIISDITDKIAKYNPDKALNIDHKLRSLNPHGNRFDSEDDESQKSIHTVEDVLIYAKKRYNLKINKEIISMWKNDLVSKEIAIADIIMMVDSMGIRKLKKNRDLNDEI
ncbi:MAG: DUF6036 family nucleotidyltransferase [Chitinispirillia bacterium]|jgi:hypothetical protein